MRRLGAALVVFLAAALSFSPAAGAHVTVDPASAPQGAEITLGFRVPSEEATADTVKVQIFFPTAHPILGVDPAPIRGWEDTTVTQHLTVPIQTDDGPVTSVISEVQWSGGPIPPGNFVEFDVLAQSLPTNTNEVVFKVLQTYSNGDIVRWIDPVTAAEPNPPHPTPVLRLVPPGAGAVANPTPSVTVDTSKFASVSAVNSAKTQAAIGIAVGILGVLVGAGALTMARRSRRAPAAGVADGEAVPKKSRWFG
jgi:uncharacterized protein YcnI